MIRPPKTDDLQGIVAIYNQAISAGFQTCFTEPLAVDEMQQWFQHHLDPCHPLFVFEQEGQVIGWLSVSPYREGRLALRFTAEISYFVHRDHLGKRVGTQLLSHAIPACRISGYTNLLAILIDRNTASIRLLEKFGFRKWGYLPDVAIFGNEKCGQYYYGLTL